MSIHVTGRKRMGRRKDRSEKRTVRECREQLKKDMQERWEQKEGSLACVKERRRASGALEPLQAWHTVVQGGTGGTERRKVREQ